MAKDLKFDGRDFKTGPYWDADVEKVRAAVKKSGVNLRILAENIGVNRIHLSATLRGIYKMTPRLRRQLLEICDPETVFDEIIRQDDTLI